MKSSVDESKDKCESLVHLSGTKLRFGQSGKLGGGNACFRCQY